MIFKRQLSDEPTVTTDDVAYLRKALKEQVGYYERNGDGPLLAEGYSHHATIGVLRHLKHKNEGYLASGHMDGSTALLFAEAVNVLPKLLDERERLLARIAELEETVEEVKEAT